MKLTTSFSNPALFRSHRAAATPAPVLAPLPITATIPVRARIEPPASFRAELRAKRLGGASVRDDHYTATLPTTGRTPYELIAALAEAVSGIQELCSADPSEERLVLQISLTR